MTTSPILPQTIQSGAYKRPRTVLVVGEHNTFSNLIWCQLTALGYHVLTAAGRTEAAETIITQGPAGTDLLIMEMHAPVIEGDAFMEWFLKENPDAKVLLMCNEENTVKLGENIGLLQKPYRMETFGERVREFLEIDADAAHKKAA